MTDPAARPAATPFPPLDIPEDLEPIYANLVRISHSPAELVLDFARILPGYAAAKGYARILMSPVGAKLFYRALGENLARYEAAFGEIALPGDPNLAADLFRQAKPPEPHTPD
jgi:hypothetical protein